MEKKGKLELTWVGKYEEEKLEPRILIEDKSKSYGESNTENMLIHGDNLLALKALENKYTGMIKCIYIDPPYNTGAAFEHYDDNLEHSIWLGIMKKRLEILRNLLAEDGTIWIQIDDEEQAYLKVLCDEIFGRNNFVNMISVNMKNVAGVSGGGEDKKIKKNCEYVLVYARNYDLMPLFNGPYLFTEMSELVEQYRNNGKSWHYTSVLKEAGEKILFGTTIDGDGNEIKLYKRKGVVIKSVNQIMKEESLSEKEVYYKCYAAYCQKKGWENFKPRNAEYVLLHTLSHMLIKEMSMQSGYSSSALHERIYSSENMCGILIYTGAADKEGSLGGLVELGGMNKFLPLLKGALENGLTCTTDPECFMKNPTSERLNGAACHSCTMISETACENGNRLLDRALVVPVPEHEEMGYFRELVRDLCGIQV